MNNSSVTFSKDSLGLQKDRAYVETVLGPE